MRRWAGAAAIGLGVAACTLVTDLDGFTSDVVVDAGASSSGDTPATERDGDVESGDAVPSCTADTDSDPHHCGRCGNDCLGGACDAGKCGPSILGQDFERPFGVTVSQGKLYVGHDGALVELDLDGKNPKPVVQDVQVTYVWGTDTDVFFTDDKAGSVLRWSHTADGKTSLVVGAPAISGVAASPTHVYYTIYAAEDAGGGIYRVPFSMASQPEKLRAWDRPECVAWADGTTYFAGDGVDTANVLREGGETTELLSGGGPTGIFVLGDDAFITRQTAGELLRVSLSTKESEVLARDLDGPSGVVATPTAVYWVEYKSGKLGVLVR